jgi:hypothetical protein
MKPNPIAPTKVIPHPSMLDPKRFKPSGGKEMASFLETVDVAPVDVVAVDVEAPVWVREVIIEPSAVLDAWKVAAAAPTGVG